jgi:hypothetical protein
MINKHNFARPILYLAITTGLLLLIPLIAMQFTIEVNWTLSDFIIAGILIFGAGLAYIIISGKSETLIYRVAVGFALFTGFFLIWSNLAVGLIGSENNEINLLYFLVIGVGVVGAFLTKFKAKGLMYTLIAMATAQMIITITAPLKGMSEVPGSSVYEILFVNGFFITLFLVGAFLFRSASDSEINAEI